MKRIIPFFEGFLTKFSILTLLIRNSSHSPLFKTYYMYMKATQTQQLTSKFFKAQLIEDQKKSVENKKKAYKTFTIIATKSLNHFSAQN